MRLSMLGLLLIALLCNLGEAFEDSSLLREIDLTFGAGTQLSPNAQSVLEKDVFDKLDANKDGFVDCKEMEVLYDKYAKLTSQILVDKDNKVLKSDVVGELEVIAPKEEDDSVFNCVYESYVVNTTPEDLSTELFGEDKELTKDQVFDGLVAVMKSVCAEQQKEERFTLTSSFTKRKSFLENQVEQVKTVKLSDYNEFKNENCKAVDLPKNRRRLWLAAVVRVAAYVSLPVVAAAAVVVPWVMAGITHNNNNCSYMGNVANWYGEEGLWATYQLIRLFGGEEWYHRKQDGIWKRCYNRRLLSLKQ